MNKVKKYAFFVVFITVFFMSTYRNANAIQVFSIGADVRDYAFTLLSGEAIKMSDYIDKKCVIIEFWADYCKSCTKFMKELEKLHVAGKYPDVEYMGLVCEWGVSFDRARNYVAFHSITFPQIWIEKKSDQFKIGTGKGASLSDYALPKRVLIDKTGKVIIEDREKIEDEAEIRKWLEKMLAECSGQQEHMM